MEGEEEQHPPRLSRSSSGPVVALFLLVAIHLGSFTSVVHCIRVPGKAAAETRTEAGARTVPKAARGLPTSAIRVSYGSGNAAVKADAAALNLQLNGGTSAPVHGRSFPFILLHGAREACNNRQLTHLTSFLAEQSGATGFCIEVGNGVRDSLFMDLAKQADNVCSQVKAIAELSDGFNLVGLSQGNLIGRALVEFCDDGPPVHNFVSLAGPHAGVAAVPLCGLLSLKFCELLNEIIQVFVYSPYVQKHFAPAEYLKIPTHLEAYYRASGFLPRLNNEVAGNRNSTYRKRFSALNHLALIQFEQDQVLIPASTAWFGFFAPNDYSKVLAPEDTELYRYDWIGLKALDEAGKVSFIKFPGEHLKFSDVDAVKHIIPYLLPTNSGGRIESY